MFRLTIFIALQDGCAHLGSHVAYSVIAAVCFIHNVTYIYCAIVSRVKCVACAKVLVSVVPLLLELSVNCLIRNCIYSCLVKMGA